MLEIYYGAAKGKTNLCVGAAVRAALREKNVLVVSFDSENAGFERLIDYAACITWLPQSADVCEYFDHAARMAMTCRYTMLVFDGIFDVVAENKLSAAEVYEFLSNAPDSMEIICTGVSVPEKFLSIADETIVMTRKEDK